MVQEPSGIIEAVSDKIARFEPLDVTEHFGFAVVRIEDFVLQKAPSSQSTVHRLLRQIADVKSGRLVAVKDLKDFNDIVDTRRFVQGNADRLVIDNAEVHPVRFGNF